MIQPEDVAATGLRVSGVWGSGSGFRVTRNAASDSLKAALGFDFS